MPFFDFDGFELQNMLVGAANQLGKNKEKIDALNVFPVPDGDTGTNMYLTLLAGVKASQAVKSGRAGEVAAAVARGALLGARGNSGVILSQVLDGFARELHGRERATASDVARSFKTGTRLAYQAVTNPVEGTILTMSRRIAEEFAAALKRSPDLLRGMVHTCRQAQQELQRSTELLPALKQTGVVDAGAKGLVVILEGILFALKQAAAHRDIKLFDLAAEQQKEFVNNRFDTYNAVIEHTYCTEFILQGPNLPLEQIRRELHPFGDCLLVAGTTDVLKIHIHSNHPGLVLECGLKYGALNTVQINNMEEQHRHTQPSGTPAAPLGVVCVACGDGLTEIMYSLGAGLVVQGGQTMNPSLEDLARAINEIPAKEVLVLPNNKNIILTAYQAAKLVNHPVQVIPSRTIPQGLAALLAFNPHGDSKETAARMTAALKDVQSGEVTKAVKTTSINGTTIHAGQWLALDEGSVAGSGDDITQVAGNLIGLMIARGAALITIYTGADFSAGEAGRLLNELRKKHSEVEFEIHRGGQPLYPLIISGE